MKSKTVAAIVCGISILAGTKCIADIIASEDYIVVISPESDKIVLIDVKAVKVKTTKIDKGLETREVTVEGIRRETIRGNDKEHEFRDTSTDRIVSDLPEARKAYPISRTPIVGNLLNQVHRPFQCKPGHRYLVLISGPKRFLVEVPKDNEDWRKQVRKYAWNAPTTK